MLCKQGDWFSFAKRRAPSLVYIDNNRSCVKHWKSRFFLIDRRAIPDSMVWRHPSAAIDDPRLAAGSFSMADKSRVCDSVLWGVNGNVMGIHDFLCLPEWTGAEVQEEPHLDDHAVGTPSSKILAKAEASQKRKASTSGATSRHVTKCTSDIDDDDACGGSSAAPTAEGPGTRDSRGKGIMANDVVAPSVSVSRPRPSFGPAPLFRDVSGDGIHTDFFPFSAGPYYATYLEGGVDGNCEFTREEWDAPYWPTFGVLTKEVFKDPTFCKTVVDQFPTPGEMVRVKSLSDDQLTTKMSVLYWMMMSHSGELLARYHGPRLRERRGRKRSSLDNLYAKVARLSADLNRATILEAKKDKEILRLKATPSDFASFFRGQFYGLVQKFLASDKFSRVQGELHSLAASAGFERGLSMHRTKDEFFAVLKKMAHFVPGAQGRLDEASPLVSLLAAASPFESRFGKTYRIPLDLHPRLHDPGFIMDHLPGDAIGIYSEFLWFSGIRIPFSTFLLSVLKYFKVHISQLVPLGLDKVVSFEVVCRDLNIVTIFTLFRVFQCLCKQRDWFSFSKHRNTKDVCMDDGPSSPKKWKNKFFLIDRRAIPDYLTWRHSCSCVSDDLPTNGYDRNDVERLCARLIYLREMREDVLVHSGLSSVWFNNECDLMSIYDFMTLSSWGDAKVAEELHHLSLPLLERVPSHTTAPAAEGAMIPLPTLDEIIASLPDPRLAKKSKGPSQARAEGINEADLTDLCAKIENSLERDEGTSTGAASAPTPRLGKRLGAPPSMAVVSASGPSHVGTSVHASTYGHSFSLGGAAVSGQAGKSRVEVVRRQMDSLDSLARSALARDVEYDPILKDDFGTATHGKEIYLTLFSLALGPYQIALLVSHGEKLNSRYTGLVTARNHLQEKFDRKAGYVKVLRSEVTTLDGKLERMQKDCDALGQENKELLSQKDDASDKVKELQTQLTDARVTSKNQLALEKAKSQGYKDVVDGLREEVTWFVGSDVENLVQKLLSSDEFHVALVHVAYLGINYGVERGLRMGRTDAEFEVAVQKFSNFHIGAKADFDKALVGFPTTPFPSLGKIVAAAGGTLSKVTQVLPDKHICSITSVPVDPPIANGDANQVPFEHASDDSTTSI
ncbi:hypothetical protein Tco_0893068 [Tanacetum coccineum]|uniref:Transposase (putative) gypsy type domain-containing protein n=1 Tax=Tanacetum coccineum TaxID=301880 RepID=A0ABQ5CAY3_9ASTR